MKEIVCSIAKVKVRSSVACMVVVTVGINANLKVSTTVLLTNRVSDGATDTTTNTMMPRWAPGLPVGWRVVGGGHG